MKRTCLVILVFLSFCTITYAQHLTTGFFSGINLSDIHTNSFSGKWKFKPGPVQGVFADYGFTKSLGFRIGLNYSTLYYEHKYAEQHNPVIYDYLSSSFRYDMMYPYYAEEMDLSYLTVPLQLRLTIPSRPDLILSAGTYLSHLTNQNPRFFAESKTDLGYVFSAGIDYPLSDDLSGLFSVRYIAGRKDINSSYRNGSFDFTIGIGFKGHDSQNIPNSDSSASRFTMMYFAGVNSSRNYEGSNAMGCLTGVSSGLRIDIALDELISFRTGLSFEQKGYSFNDSSDYPFAHIVRKYATYKVDTRVTLDYVEIPAMIKFYLGKSKIFSLSTGPWLAFKLNARATGTGLSTTPYYQGYRLLKTTINDDIGTIIKGTDAGWTFATAAAIPVKGMNRIEIGIEYKHGFRDVYDGFSGAPVNVNSPERSIVNRTISVHLGYIIPGRNN
jgi:opacity protein-like surface antigen